MKGALTDDDDNDDYVGPLHNGAVTSRESPRPWNCPVEDVSHRDVTSSTSMVHSSTAGRQTTQHQLIASDPTPDREVGSTVPTCLSFRSPLFEWSLEFSTRSFLSWFLLKFV